MMDSFDIDDMVSDFSSNVAAIGGGLHAQCLGKRRVCKE